MDSAGIVNGKIYIFNDYEWLHAIFVGISTPIIIVLLTCHTYKCCLNYHSTKLSKRVSHMTAGISPTDPRSATKELSVESKSKSNSLQKQNTFEFPKKKDNFDVVYYYIWMMHVLVFVALIIGLLDCIFSFISYFHFNVYDIISHNCQILTTLIVTCWSLIKNALMFISLLRILAVFKNSVFEYRTVITNIFLGYFISVFIVGALAVFYLGEGTTIYNADKHYYWCQYSLKLYFLGIVGVFDFGTNIILGYMFIRPLIKLSAMTVKPDASMYRCILFFISI